MLTPIEANKKYLTKLVQEVISENLLSEAGMSQAALRAGGPVEKPDFDSAVEKIISEQREKFKQSISSLDAAAKWAITKTSPKQRQKGKSTVFIPNDKMGQVMSALERATINNDEEQSVENIHNAIAAFTEATDDGTWLHKAGSYFSGKNTGGESLSREIEGTSLGFDRASKDYAVNFYNYLKQFRQEEVKKGTSMNVQIMKLLNIRGPKIESSKGFRDFYINTLNIVNKSAPQAGIHYSAWKVASDDLFRATVDAWWFPISIALGFISLPIAAPAGGFTIASGITIAIVEFILWEIVTILFVPGDMHMPRVNVSYSNIVSGLEELKQDLEAYEGDDLQEFVSRFEGELERADAFGMKYISDWVSIENQSAENLPKPFKKIKQNLMVGGDRATASKIDLKKIRKKRGLIKKIDDKIKDFKNFYEGYEKADPKRLTLSWRMAFKTFVQDAKDLLKENARVDTTAEEPRINKKISKIISQDFYDTSMLPGLMSTFKRMHRNWVKLSANKKISNKTNVGNTWGYIQRNFSRSYADKGNPAKNLDIVMEKGWCVFASMPTFAITGRDENLYVGVLKGGRKSNSAIIGSFMVKEGSIAGLSRGATQQSIIDGFAKMIRYGAIGPNPKTKKVTFPEHDTSALYELSAECRKKADDMGKVKEDLDRELKSAKIRSNFYNKTVEFIDAYTEFYYYLGIVLHKCASSNKVQGRCGGKLSSDIYSTFTTAVGWHSAIEDAY